MMNIAKLVLLALGVSLGQTSWPATFVLSRTSPTAPTSLRPWNVDSAASLKAVHDTADSVRAYVRARIEDSLAGYLPLAAGAASPLTGTLHGTSLNFTGWTSDAPISVSMNYSNAYAHAITVANPSLTAGQRLTVDFGQAASTNNQANFGFAYAGTGSTANKITLGLYGNNDLVSIAGTGVMTVRDLGTGFVRASSGALSSSALVASEIPNLDASKITSGTLPDARIASAATWNAKLSTVTADANSRAANTFYAAPNGAAGVATFRAIVAADVPTLNQSTTGNAATATKWATPRTLTIGATGKALDGSANVSWSLAEIGAAPSHSVASNAILKSNGSGGFSASTATDDGTTFATTGRLGWGGGILRDYTGNASIGALYGSSITTPSNSNHSFAWAKDGSAAALNGGTQVSLQIGGADKAVATSTGLAVTGALSATSTLSWGGAAAIPSSDNVVQGNGGGVLGHRTTLASSLNTATASGFYDSQFPADGPQGTVWTHMIRSMHSGGSTTNQWMFDIAATFGGGAATEGFEGYYVRTTSAGSTPGWRQLWHSGNLPASAFASGRVPYGNGSTLSSTATLVTKGANLTAGVARVGAWSSDPTVARWGLAAMDDASGYGILQYGSGQITTRVPAGLSWYVNAGAEMLLDNTGFYVYPLSGTGNRELVTTSGGKLASVSTASVGSGVTSLTASSAQQQYISAANPTITLPPAFSGGHFVLINRYMSGGSNSCTLQAPSGLSILFYGGSVVSSHLLYFNSAQSVVRHVYSDGTNWFLDGTDLP